MAELGWPHWNFYDGVDNSVVLEISDKNYSVEGDIIITGSFYFEDAVAAAIHEIKERL